MTNKASTSEPLTQEARRSRQNWPAWMREMPRSEIRRPATPFQLIDLSKAEEALLNASPQAVERIKKDMEFLDYELLRLFRERDFEAKVNQNEYRRYQIGYMVLAALATLFGSLLSLSFSTNPDAVPFFAFLETVVALFTTFLATISGRQSPLPKWLSNRHRAEMMRREYFRYLLDLEPYTGLNDLQRRRTLSLRAAKINLDGAVDGHGGA